MIRFFLGRGGFWLVFCVLAAIVNVGAGTILDYDGDGKTDLAVVRYDPSTPNFVWYILQSRDGFRANVWGLQSDVPRFDGDFDGDGKTDLVVQRFGWWYILNSHDNTLTAVQWEIGHRLVPQDYDGDGKTDIAVYDGGLWIIRQSSNGQSYSEQFGRSSGIADHPLTGGDYDGDGKADLAVVRYTPPDPAGTFIPTTLFIRRSIDGNWASYELGDGRFTGVLTGDFDGDGISDVAMWRGNLWLWIRSSDNKLEGVRFGDPTLDAPVPGDYDGDGKTDPAVYRRGSFVSPQSYYYIQQSRDGFLAVPWGTRHDVTDGDVGVGGTRYLPAVGF